jgi:hypothetical protein
MAISFMAPFALSLSICEPLSIRNSIYTGRNYLACKAALRTRRRADSISARDFAISATTVPVERNGDDY